MRIITFGFLSLYVAGSAALMADQVTLKNGDRLTGKVVKKDGAKLTFKTDLAGEVTIDWAAVTALNTDEAVTVVLPSGQSVQGPVATAENKLEVKAPAGAQTAPIGDVKAVRNPAEEYKYQRLLAPRVWDLWAGYFDLGYAVTRGNARTNTLNTAVNAARVTNTDKTTIYFNQIFATATVNRVSADTAQAIRGGWAYNHGLFSKGFVNVFNDYEYDRFQNLDLRFVAGGGAGYSPIKSERTRLDLMAGVAYNREKFGPQDSSPASLLVKEETRNSAEAYWGDDLTYKLNGTTSLRQSYRMFNNLTNTGVYRINFDLGVATQLKKWLSFQVTASDRFLSNPVFGRQRNDLLLTTGLRVNFAR